MLTFAAAFAAFDRHFYAHECPDLLVADMRTMFGKGGGAYGLIEGKEGYSSG